MPRRQVAVPGDARGVVPGRAEPAPDPTPAGRRSGDGASADQLWAALRGASDHGDARRRAQAQAALFRHYRSLARTMARRPTAVTDEPDATVHAAELGLARAIDSWHEPDGDGFEAFARRAIAARLQRHARRVLTGPELHPRRKAEPA